MVGLKRSMQVADLISLEDEKDNCFRCFFDRRPLSFNDLPQLADEKKRLRRSKTEYDDNEEFSFASCRNFFTVGDRLSSSSSLSLNDLTVYGNDASSSHISKLSFMMNSLSSDKLMEEKETSFSSSPGFSQAFGSLRLSNRTKSNSLILPKETPATRALEILRKEIDWETLLVDAYAGESFVDSHITNDNNAQKPRKFGHANNNDEDISCSTTVTASSTN